MILRYLALSAFVTHVVNCCVLQVYRRILQELMPVCRCLCDFEFQKNQMFFFVGVSFSRFGRVKYLISKDQRSVSDLQLRSGRIETSRAWETNYLKQLTNLIHNSELEMQNTEQNKTKSGIDRTYVRIFWCQNVICIALNMNSSVRCLRTLNRFRIITQRDTKWIMRKQKRMFFSEGSTKHC